MRKSTEKKKKLNSTAGQLNRLKIIKSRRNTHRKKKGRKKDKVQKKKATSKRAGADWAQVGSMPCSGCATSEEPSPEKATGK